jgi:hypothetical protein
MDTLHLISCAMILMGALVMSVSIWGTSRMLRLLTQQLSA